MVGRDRTQPSLTRGATLSKLMNWENDSSCCLFCPCYICPCFVYYHLPSSYCLLVFEKYELPVCLLVTTSTMIKLPLFAFWCMPVMKGAPLFSLWCMYVCPERAPYVFILVSVYPPERGLLDVFTLVSACLSDFWADIYALCMQP